MSFERRANWQKKEFAHRSKRSLNLHKRACILRSSLSERCNHGTSTPPTLHLGCLQNFATQNIVCFPLKFEFREVPKSQTKSPCAGGLSPVLVVLNKLVPTFGKKSNLKFGLIQTPQLH